MNLKGYKKMEAKKFKIKNIWQQKLDDTLGLWTAYKGHKILIEKDHEIEYYDCYIYSIGDERVLASYSHILLDKIVAFVNYKIK